MAASASHRKRPADGYFDDSESPSELQLMKKQTSKRKKKRVKTHGSEEVALQPDSASLRRIGAVHSAESHDEQQNYGKKKNRKSTSDERSRQQHNEIATEKASIQSEDEAKVGDESKDLPDKASRHTTKATRTDDSVLADVYERLIRLEKRHECDEERARIRHEITFSALEKLSGDLFKLSGLVGKDLERQAASTTGGGRVEDNGHKTEALGEASSVTSRPRSEEQRLSGRATMERCLQHYMDALDNAVTVDEVREKGKVAVRYCVRRQQPEDCHYTAQKRRRRLTDASKTTTSQDLAHSLSDSRSADPPSTPASSLTGPPLPAPVPVPPVSHYPDAVEEHDETEVPREARLLCDPNGKLIFIGDCAPLSFFQTVRRLVTSLVDSHAFAPETSGYSALENAYPRPPSASRSTEPPAVGVDIESVVSAYLEVTLGLVDLFDNARLPQDIAAWASRSLSLTGRSDMTSAVNYLVLAIGCQKSDEGVAQVYFDFAKDIAFASLGGNLGIGSVQAFILITLYMLGACQINGAFLFFGIAVRAGFSIGVHRTAVNSRFGPEAHRQRDRLWKSLRVVDLFLSTSMGRPPATSDTDCTVPYRETGADGKEVFDLLNASVQILLIAETVVLEVYSRRKISPRLTEGISRELRDWSTRWLPPLKDAVTGEQASHSPAVANGACQVLASYYYAVILVSRPFLMVELRRRLSDRPPHSHGASSGQSKLADACIDAAVLMVESVQGLIERGVMSRRVPVIISWIFASSLVLGLGLLGGFGRIIEKYCRASISALEYFGEADGHAMQYSLIAKSLLTTVLGYLEKREIEERSRRTESSSQLFGLVPQTARDAQGLGSPFGGQDGLYLKESVTGSSADKGERAFSVEGRSEQSFDFEACVLELADSFSITPDFSLMVESLGLEGDQTFGSMNLFPLLDADGHIDLANFLQE
ncbi:hypothetical protein OQA88_1298 [Cercophora sp. LCS_1]